jgi:hypothetical protein
VEDIELESGINLSDSVVKVQRRKDLEGVNPHS